MTPRILTLADCELSLEMEPDCTSLEGNVSCIDDETDAANVAHVRDQIERGNDWAWCVVTVRLRYRGLEATDTLCGCSYRSREDFTAPGGYYDDMVHACLAELRAQIGDLCRTFCAEAR